MSLELSMRLVVVSAHGGFFEGTVHALDLAIGPGMIGFGKAVVDAVLGTSEFKSMSPEDFAPGQSELDVGSGGASVAWGGEMSAVVREDGVDAIRNEFDELLEELRSRPTIGLRDELSEGELGSAINGDEEMKLAFCGAHFGEIEMEVTDGIGFELFPLWAWSMQVWQATDPMALEAPMKRGAGQLRNGGLKCIKTIIQRQERVLAKGDRDRLLLPGEGGGSRLLWPHGSIFHRSAFAPFGDGLGIDAVTLGEG